MYLEKKPLVQPFEGSVGEALVKIKELKGRLFSGEIDNPTYDSLSAPFLARIDQRLKEVSCLPINPPEDRQRIQEAMDRIKQSLSGDSSVKMIYMTEDDMM